jgi:predicted DsbA family dithiol-disulfide isomerase
MQIEIWSDVICPWCYIGKRNFETALDRSGHREQIDIIWRSYELDPNAPGQQPGSIRELLAHKYQVSLQEADEMIARVTAKAANAGLEYHMDIAKRGNTFDAHRLLHFAVEKQVGDKAMEAIMHAYFCEGLAVGNPAALAGVAPQFDIAESEARAILESDDYADAVRADETRAASFGISGVPFFVFDEKSGISGAQPVEVFAQALTELMQTDQR